MGTDYLCGGGCSPGGNRNRKVGCSSRLPRATRLWQDTEPHVAYQSFHLCVYVWMHRRKHCVVLELWCAVWVCQWMGECGTSVVWTALSRKALYEYSPFTFRNILLKHWYSQAQLHLGSWKLTSQTYTVIIICWTANLWKQENGLS